MKNEEEKKESLWYYVFWIIIILVILNIYNNYKEKSCDLTFSKYTYNDVCASACSIKCSNEGFSYLSSSYFEPYLSGEEMANTELYKRCECNCGGCRE